MPLSGITSHSFMKKDPLVRIVLILLLFVLFFGSIYFAAPFFKPLAVAFLVALLMLPLSRKLENKGIKRIWSTIISTGVVVLFIACIFGLLLYQAKQMSSNAEQLEKKGKEKMEQVEQFVKKNTGLTSKEIKSFMEKSGPSKFQGTASNIAGGILTSLTDLLLMLVYTFLFLQYRQHLKQFILRMTPRENRNDSKKTMEESSAMAQQYLAGRFLLIGILAVLYSIAFTLLGVKYAIFYSVLAALLSLIPYIGNIIGVALPLIMTIIYNSLMTALGVLIVFSVIQFIDTYIFEPMVIGKKVNLNPMVTILIAVLGGILWGVPGLIIAIPYLGIVLIIFSKVDGLEPIAFFLSNGEDVSSGDKGS